MVYIETLEESLGKKAVKNLLPLQAGDVPATYADTADLAQAVGFSPSTPVRVGIARFVAWYRAYHNA
jgi:UDP-glucuronate 4-epimerase